MIVENDNSITNYDRKGKKVLGWKFQKNNKILKELKHFKNRDKDYIVKISKKDTESSLAKKILVQEHKLYPKAILKVFNF